VLCIPQVEARELRVPRRRRAQVLVHGHGRGVRPALWHRRHRGRGAAPGDAGAVLHVRARFLMGVPRLDSGWGCKRSCQLLGADAGSMCVGCLRLMAAVQAPQPRGHPCTIGAQHCFSKCHNAVLRIQHADAPAAGRMASTWARLTGMWWPQLLSPPSACTGT
jgi:hypothetical protein